MRIYVDSSVFGGCFDPEFEIWSGRLVDFFKIGKFIAVISQVSESELKFAPKRVRQILKDIPTKNLEIVNLTDEARLLASRYIKEKIVKKITCRHPTHCHCNYSTGRPTCELEF